MGFARRCGDIGGKMHRMAVKVQYLKPGTDNTAENEHEQGEFIEIKEGHLVVGAKELRGRRTVAIYAPGQWVKAEAE